MVGHGLFLQVSSTMLAVTLAALTGAALLGLAGLATRQFILCRLGLRNTVRRPAQALLMLCGLALSTAVITASFGLTDSFTDSARAQRLARMGNVDESVTGPFSGARITATLARLRRAPEVQAAAALTFISQGPTITSARTGLSLHDITLFAVPPAFDAVYGPLTDLLGRRVRFADLQPGDLFIGATLARAFDARPGDPIQIAFGATRITGTVRALLATDPSVTAGESVGRPSPEIIMPLARLQHAFPDAPNTISVKNVGSGGMDDIGPGGRRSQAVIRLLQRLFPGAPASLTAPHALGQTDFDTFKIHPLKPDVVAEQETLQVDKVVFLSSAGQQFSWLPQLFTLVLVGAGMLLLALLMILLATERRAELGMSRAIGVRRPQLVQLLLFEGCAYGVAAALLGVPLGIAATALELAALAHLPTLAAGQAVGNTIPLSVIIPPHLWLSWQSGLSAWCLGVLTTLAVVLLTALWISRAPIVTAMRDLDEPPAARNGLHRAWRALWSPPLDAAGLPIPETRAGRLSRYRGAVSGLWWGLWARGPLSLVAGGGALLLSHGRGQDWLGELAGALFIAGGGLIIGWAIASVAHARSLGRRVGLSLVGLGWIAVGLGSQDTFLALFQPVVSYNGPPPGLAILLSLLLPVAGAVLLLMANADLPVPLIGGALRRLPGLAPISRVSLVYPLTYRLRMGVTVTLLSLVTFLVLLLVTVNFGAIQEAQTAANTGGFQLQATVFGSQLSRYGDLAPKLRALARDHTRGSDFAAVGLLRLMYDFPRGGAPMPILLDAPGQPSYSLAQPPQVADDQFLSHTTMPLYARAGGFSSDRQVWDAVRDHPGAIVLQYDARVGSLPTSSGFTPFGAEIPDRADYPAHFHRVTVIGLMPASTSWRVLMSVTTAGRIVHPPDITFINTYLFRLRPGVSEAGAAHALDQILKTAQRGIAVQSLDQASLNGITAALTLFLSGDLALGLVFGALAIGVIAGRAVVERRQQIGMLRALGFPRALVRRAFLVEYGFVVVISLAVGAALALWLASRVARASYQDFPLPMVPIILILLGSFLVAILSTVLPARRAARLPPAEALRYE
ncbi:MAG TPA: FtsX-like permease family protein [Chloroflexota bacterium]|nr:FtsX-like permease family protein [Chloroflexota bacterium]